MLRAVRTQAHAPPAYLAQHAASVQRDHHGKMGFNDPVRSDLRSKPLQAMRDPPSFQTMEKARKEQEKMAPKEMSKKKERELIEEQLGKMLFDRDGTAHEKDVDEKEEEFRNKRDRLSSHSDSE